jgi:hypothetical protein
MRTALLILTALAATGSSGAAAAADVWKWVDEKGITHYSDQPVPGAIKIEVRAGNIASSAASSPAPTVSSTPDSSSSDASAPRYRDFEIWQPEPNQSIINTGGQVNVEIRVEPSVQPLHTVSLYLDGKVVSGFPRNTLSYALTGVPRGAHSVMAVVVDQSGKTIQQTPAVAFTVRQESIAQPPVGPTLRPPPKPQPRAANKLPATQPSYGALKGAPATIDPATNLPVDTKPAPKPKKP